MRKRERKKIVAFKIWFWRRIPWTARGTNAPVLERIAPTCSREEKQKLRYFGHVIGRNDGMENEISLGVIEGRRRREYTKL